MNRFNVTHSENPSGAIMQRRAAEQMHFEPAAEAALLIPKEPCGACDPNIPKVLPKGSRLFVIDPHSTAVYSSTSGAALEGMKFSRQQELEFRVPKNMIRLKAVGAQVGQAAATFALTVLAAWLLGKVEQSLIEREINDLRPKIAAALQDKRATSPI